MASDLEQKPNNVMQTPPTSMQKPEMATDNQKQSSSKKLRGRISGKVSFPQKTIDEALRVPQSIWKDNAGNPFPLGDLQKSLKINGDRAFQTLVRASQMYGLTVGSYSTNPNNIIKLSELGSAIVAPQIDDKPEQLKIDALQKPKVFHDFLQAINNRIIPPRERCESTLVQQHNVGSSVVKSCYSVLMRNVRALDLVVRDDGQNEVLQLDNPPTETTTAQPEQTQEISPPVETEVDEQPEQEQDISSHDDKSEQIFIAHGKNRTPLEQLVGILRGFNIKYVVAVEEPNAGLPVSEKVAKAMHECTSGIFIFTADEKMTKEDGTEVVWPNLNVVYELGAGSVLYENRIIILKEKDVTFPSDFSGVSHISFNKDDLNSKGIDIMKELANMGFIHVTN